HETRRHLTDIGRVGVDRGNQLPAGDLRRAVRTGDADQRAIDTARGAEGTEEVELGHAADIDRPRGFQPRAELDARIAALPAEVAVTHSIVERIGNGSRVGESVDEDVLAV